MLLSLSGIVILLMGHGHYSIDIVLSYWITTRVWWTYHSLSNGTSHKANPFSNAWWFYILRYFEQNVGRPLPLGYNLPLPSSVVRKIPFMRNGSAATRLYKRSQ